MGTDRRRMHIWVQALLLGHATVLWPFLHLCRYRQWGSGLRGTGVLALGCAPAVWVCATAAFDYEPIAAGRFGSTLFVKK